MEEVLRRRLAGDARLPGVRAGVCAAEGLCL